MDTEIDDEFVSGQLDPKQRAERNNLMLNADTLDYEFAALSPDENVPSVMKSDSNEEEESKVCSWQKCLRWRQTSEQELADVEKRMLSSIWDKIELSFVPVENGTLHIRTLVMNKSSKNTPLVMLHGMGAGIGMWILNLEALAKDRPVYAIDLLGFGRSTRVDFPKNAAFCETLYTDTLESWRIEIGLEKKFALLGHSMGGFIASAYAIGYPQNIKHLLLIDPWGFIEHLPSDEYYTNTPLWLRTLLHIASKFYPMTALRALGPLGHTVVKSVRADIIMKYNSVFTDNTVTKYIYHCNVQKPSGEMAYKYMAKNFGWARHPMGQRIVHLDEHVPIDFVFGAKSWLNSSVAYDVKHLRAGCHVDIVEVHGAGHHVYADRYKEFNFLMNTILKKIDEVH